MNVESNPTSMPKACIVYLVDTYDLPNFRLSLSLVHNIKTHEPLQIIAFHELSLPSDVIQELSAKYSVRFVPIEFMLPKYPRAILEAIPEVFKGPGCEFTLGYRHMCRFFAGEVFKRPELAEYDYVIRLDTDSFILGPLLYPIEQMVKTGAVYGYRVINEDHESCYRGFYNAVSNFCYTHNVRMMPVTEGSVYYTNFEVYKMDRFKSGLYQDFYDYLDRTGGFFTARWGDHILRYTAVVGLRWPTTYFNFHYAHAEVGYPPTHVVDLATMKADLAVAEASNLL
jgi:hypothetical protein